jgi:hypothetical protein
MAEVLTIEIVAEDGKSSLRVVVPTDTETMDRLNRHMPWTDCRDVQWPPPSFPGPGLADSVRLPTLPEYPELRLNEFFWPWSASRWAIARFIVRVDEVKAFPGKASKVRLRIECAGEAIYPPMWMLPIRPILGVEGAEGLGVAILVDERYFDQFTPVSPITSATWQSVLTTYGATETAPLPDATHYWATVPDDHPFRRMIVPPYILGDFAAAALGKCIVRKFDGALKSIDTKIGREKLKAAVVQWSRHRLYGGTIFDLDDTISQGIKPTIPAFVKVSIPVKGTDSERPYVSIVDVSTMGAPYTLWPRGGTVMIRTLPGAESTVPTGLNLADCDRVAKQAVRVYLEHVAAQCDILFPGFVPFDPESITDVLWRFGPESVSTRVMRQPANWVLDSLSYAQPQSAPATALVRCGTRESLYGYTWLATVAIMASLTTFSYGDNVVLLTANNEVIDTGKYYLAVEMNKRPADGKRVFVTACCCLVSGPAPPDPECTSYSMKVGGVEIGTLTPDGFGNYVGTITTATLSCTITVSFEYYNGIDVTINFAVTCNTADFPCYISAWSNVVGNPNSFSNVFNIQPNAGVGAEECPDTSITINFLCAGYGSSGPTLPGGGGES